MKNGNLVEIGTTKEILTKPKEIYTKSLVSSVPPTNKKIERFKLISPDGGIITNESSTLTNSIIQNWAVRETSYEKLLDFKNVTKIFHYARADLTFIKHYLKIEISNIQDTKIKSRLARSYSDKHGLKDLIKEFINIDVSKQLQSSDFGGNLTPAQLKYCANDVIYLHKINEELNKILIREKRMKLYEDCIKFINTRVNLDLASFKDDIWSH